MSTSTSLIYKLSNKVANLLNIYLNGINRRSPLKYFSIFQNRNVPKPLIRNIFKEIVLITKGNQIEKLFKIDLKESIEVNIITIINGYKKILSSSFKEYKVESFKVNELKKIDFYNLYGISGEDKELIRLMRYLYKVKEYFKLVLLNGSIGSRDYKPGWSDIDLFIVINKESLDSVKKIRRLRGIALKINNFLMRYSILQHHKVVYSSEYHLQANYNEFFPITCLKTGQIITDMNNFEIFIPPQEESALNYFQSIYLSSKDLYFKSKIKPLNTFSKSIFFHRIFSFPFSFLQCFNFNIYKKYSYDKLKIEFSEIFPNISAVYNKINQFYLDWKIKKLRTLKVRRVLSSIISINYLNKIFVRNEKDIIYTINNHYTLLSKEGLLDQYNKYLDIANDYLETQFSSYHNQYRPYNKYKFYDYCIDKANKIFSKFQEINAIYQFGTISAPGNSDIDLMFVVKKESNIFKKYIKTFMTQFTSNERFIIFKHHPIVVSEEIAPNINFLLPYKDISKLYGKDIEFKDISYIYSRFALLVELLIYVSPKKLLSRINKVEDLRTHLQVIKSISYTFELFREIYHQFNYQTTIDFEVTHILFKKNEYIRKNVFFININKIIRHIKNSFQILNDILCKIRLELSQIIESNALKKKTLLIKSSRPVLRIGNYFFLANKKKLLKIHNSQSRLKSIRRSQLYKRYYYYPWSFYFFFKHKNFVKNEFAKGIAERDFHVRKFLKFITSYNNGKTEYAPFWYYDKLEFHLYNLLQKIWKRLPYSFQKTSLFYYYFMLIFRKFNNLIETINNNSLKELLLKLLKIS